MGFRVFAGVFEEIRVLDVVILWFLRGEMCGGDGQETMLKLGLGISQFFVYLFCGESGWDLRVASARTTA
jgi:hypothetical protein